ncbi:MAG: AlpA family transcriptional regulator [Steroidobacteraceae bacterium]
MDTLAVHRSRTVQILRLPDVCRATGLGRSMVYQLEASNQFPRRVKIGARAVGWIEEEIQSWLSDRIAQSRGNAA